MPPALLQSSCRGTEAAGRLAVPVITLLHKVTVTCNHLSLKPWRSRNYCIVISEKHTNKQSVLAKSLYVCSICKN